MKIQPKPTTRMTRIAFLAAEIRRAQNGARVSRTRGSIMERSKRARRSVVVGIVVTVLVGAGAFVWWMVKGGSDGGRTVIITPVTKPTLPREQELFFEATRNGDVDAMRGLIGQD